MHDTSHGIAAALKVDAPESSLWERENTLIREHPPGQEKRAAFKAINDRRAKVWHQRIARKLRMVRHRRRGWGRS